MGNESSTPAEGHEQQHQDNTNSQQEGQDDDGILCPFLKIANPDVTSGWWTTVGDISREGLEYPMALFVYFDITTKQKGLWSTLKGEILDLYALDQVPGISHEDRFNKYKETTKQKLNSAANPQGFITMNDLVETKKFLATQKEGMKLTDISNSSKLETALLFLGAGGDPETLQVKVDDVLTFLRGTKPESFTQKIDFWRLKKVNDAANKDMW